MSQAAAQHVMVASPPRVSVHTPSSGVLSSGCLLSYVVPRLHLQCKQRSQQGRKKHSIASLSQSFTHLLSDNMKNSLCKGSAASLLCIVSHLLMNQSTIRAKQVRGKDSAKSYYTRQQHVTRVYNVPGLTLQNIDLMLPDSAHESSTY